MAACKLCLEDRDLSLRVFAQLQLIGVRSVEQLRVLLKMRERTRSQNVTTLRRASSVQMGCGEPQRPQNPHSITSAQNSVCFGYAYHRRD